MAQSGNLIGNFINWYIGYICLSFWQTFGDIFSVFGIWQLGLDGMTGTYEAFKMADVGDAYTREMTIAK